MASKYKRHSQGGRFKAANFGDLGLRALKDQQERQIRGLKDQAREEAQMGYDHLREMRGAAAREIEHNRQLQNFYTKRDNLAIENTEFRGKTEYDRLMGEAREHEKQAKFWQNFSTTYAQQYVEAAHGIYDVATTVQSNNQLDIIDADPKYHKFVASYSKLNNLASKEQVDEAVGILRDKNATEEQKSKYLGHIVELGFRMNHKTKLALLQRELNHWPQEELNLRSLAAKQNLQWNEKTAGQFFYLRARELLRAYGVDPSSKAGKEFLKGVEEKATEARNELSGISTANAHDEYARNLSESTKDLVGKSSFAVNNGSVIVSGPSSIEYNNDFNSRIMFEGSRYRLSENGQVIKPTGNNVHNNMVSIMKSDIMSGRFASKEQARRHTILQLKPGADVKYEDDGSTMVYKEKDTWLGQHPSLQKEFDEAWDDYEKQQKQEFDEKKEADDFTTVTNLKQRAIGSANGTIKPTLPNGDKNPEFLDLSDQSVINNLQKQHRSKGVDSETMKFLGNIEVYNQYDLNNDIVTQDLTDKYKAGKLKELEEHLSYLPPNVQEEWESKLNQLKVLDRKGYLGTELTGKARGILIDILGQEAAKPGKLTGEHFQTVIGYIEQDILATFAEEYEKNPELSDTELITNTKAEIARKIAANGGLGEGIYRRSSAGDLSTTFYIDQNKSTDNEKAKATLKQVEGKFIANNSVAFSNGIKAVESDGKFQVGTDPNNRVYLVSLDEADTALLRINEGLEPSFNETIDYIVKNQPKSKDGTRLEARDIWNMYFKGVGIDTEVKPNVIDFASSNTENSALKADTSRMNEANKCAVGAVCKMADEGIIVIGQPTEEQKKVEKKRWLFSHPFFTMPHPLAN